MNTQPNTRQVADSIVRRLQSGKTSIKDVSELKTKCARCGKPMKFNGVKWGLHQKCKTKGEIEVAKKLNKCLSN